MKLKLALLFLIAMSSASMAETVVPYVGQTYVPGTKFVTKDGSPISAKCVALNDNGDVIGHVGPCLAYIPGSNDPIGVPDDPVCFGKKPYDIDKISKCLECMDDYRRSDKKTRMKSCVVKEKK